MREILVEDFLVHGGIQHLLQFENKQQLVHSYHPSWIDTLKKGKSRVCYLSMYGTLELTFDREELVLEHYDFEQNTPSEKGIIVLNSDHFYFAAEIDSVRKSLSQFRLIEVAVDCPTDEHCVLTLEQGVKIQFLERKLFSLDIYHASL